MKSRSRPSATTKFRRWRVENSLTLEEVSDLTGLSVSALSRVERGERQLRPQMRVLVARRLGVPLRTLFEVQEIKDEELDEPVNIARTN